MMQPDQQASIAAQLAALPNTPMNPNFPLARPRRMMGGEFDWQVKRFGLIPKPLHPQPVLHGQRQIQYGLA
ncbi:MAG: hypothetical protein RL695_2547, partial [Pseudomonadota bacterium]